MIYSLCLQLTPEPSLIFEMTDVTADMQRLLSRLPATDTYPFRSVINSEYDKRHFALSIHPASVLLAMHRAREAQELAVSYRGFKVGAAAIGITFGEPNFQIMTGVNVKPDADSTMNVHAEQVALQKAHDRGFSAISTLVVVGETQADQQSGHEMHTLHPCGLCRNALRNSSMIDPNATLIVSATPSLREIELYNLQMLSSFHESPQKQAQLAHFELPDIELLKPFVPTEQESIRLDDTTETLEGERLWDTSVGHFINQWSNALLHNRL